MTPRAVSQYECLAQNQRDESIVDELSNQLIEIPGASTLDQNGPLGPKAAHCSSDLDRIAVEMLGFTLGSKTQRAVALYLRPDGATTSEVIALNGGPYLNCLKRVEAMGFVVRKRRVPTNDGRTVVSYKIEL